MLQKIPKCRVCKKFMNKRIAMVDGVFRSIWICESEDHKYYVVELDKEVV